MQNSVWKPWSEKKIGTFLIWAPNNARGNPPYLTGNIGLASNRPTAGGSMITVIDGCFEWDTTTPHFFAELTSLIDQLPIETEEKRND